MATSSVLLLAVLLVLLPLSRAQKKILSIDFTKGKAAKGFKKPSKKDFSGGVSFTSTKSKTLAAEFTSFASAGGGFIYTKKGVKKGSYTLVLGFAEIENKFCKKGKREFSVSANGKKTGKLDVFKAAGCGVAFTSTLKKVNVAADGLLVIEVTKIKGTPFLANFVLLSGTSKPPSKPSAKPEPSASPAPPPGGRQVVYDIDCGGIDDRPDLVTGQSSIFPVVVDIKGADDKKRLSRHRFGKSFTYRLKVQKKIEYDVDLFFAESFDTNCKAGLRVFNVFVYDGGKKQSSGKALRKVDVFKQAGCRKQYVRSVKGISVGGSGVLTVELSGGAQNAMISAILVTTKDDKYKPTPGPTPFGGPKLKKVEVNVGAVGDPFVLGTRKFSTKLDVKPSKLASEKQLQSSRFGSAFQYKFNLRPAVYDLTLSFAEVFEPFCNKTTPARRVFDVFVNDKVAINNLDIFGKAGCLKGIDFKVPVKIEAGGDPTVIIRFSSVKNFATINYIKIMERMKKK